MFAVIYRGYVKPGLDSEYQKSWHKIAIYFIEYRSAIGSCLHRADDGLWIAYSRWPDRATRDAAWPSENAPAAEFPEEIKQAIHSIKNCLDGDRKLPEIAMDVVDDLL